MSPPESCTQLAEELSKITVWEVVCASIRVDGAGIAPEVVRRLKVLHETAVDHAVVWDAQTAQGNSLAVDRAKQEEYMLNTTPWIYCCLEAGELL